VNVGQSVGLEDGISVGTNVGSNVGGRVYSTMMLVTVVGADTSDVSAELK
jgi:hypothetical protein